MRRPRLFLNGAPGLSSSNSSSITARAMSRRPPDPVFRNNGCRAGPKRKKSVRGQQGCHYATAAAAEPSSTTPTNSSRRCRTSTTSPSRRVPGRGSAPLAVGSPLRLLRACRGRRLTVRSGLVQCPPLRRHLAFGVPCPAGCSPCAAGLCSCPYLSSGSVVVE